MRLAIVGVLLLAGCSLYPHKKGGPLGGSKSLPDAVDMSVVAASDAAVQTRLLKVNLDKDGQVAPRKVDGTFDDQGDGGIFTGLLLAALDCPTGAPVLKTMAKAIHDNGGMIPRHNPLVASTNGPTTRDQVSGYMLGFVERWQRCPDDRAVIKAAWQEHVTYVLKTGALGPTGDGALLTFKWIWGAVGQYFGIPEAGGGSKPEFEDGHAVTAFGVRVEKKACYPIHVGTLQIIVAAKIGKPISDGALASFCDASKGTDLVLTDWLCGRQDALQWRLGFVPDVWEYRFQRCPGWEGPDGHGEQTPGVDALLLDRLAAEGPGNTPSSAADAED